MGGHNNWPYIINLGNSIIGVAVLAMPFCFQQCGILLGMLVLLFCTWLTLASCQLLMKAGITSRRRSYEFLAYHTHGATGKLVSELGMIGMQLGTLIAQIVVIGDLGPAIISKVFGIENNSGLRTFLICVLCLSVGLPLGMLKNLRTVSRASTVCISFYCVFVVYVLCLSFPNLWTGAWYPSVHIWRPEGLFQCLPILSFSFGCQTQLFLLYDALPEPSLKAINGVISSAVNLCAVAYLLVGFFGYIAFHTQEIPGDVIAIFPTTFIAGMMKLCFVFSIVITFPVIIFPCRASIYTLLFARKAKPHEDALDNEGYIPENLFKMITISIVLGSMITGILIPNVEFILGMNGAITGTLICYIFPALFFMRVMGSKIEGRTIAQVVLFLGVSILLVSTYATLNSQDSHREKSEPIISQVENGANQPEKPVFHKPDLIADGKGEMKGGDDVKKKKDSSENEGGIRKEPAIPFPPESRNDVRGHMDVKNDIIKRKDVANKEVGSEDNQAALYHETQHPLAAGVKNKDSPIAVDEKAREQVLKDKAKEKKQDEVLAKLEQQQKEQAKILQEQKKVLKELKDHHDLDKQKAQDEEERQLHAQEQDIDNKADTQHHGDVPVVEKRKVDQLVDQRQKAPINSQDIPVKIPVAISQQPQKQSQGIQQQQIGGLPQQQHAPVVDANPMQQINQLNPGFPQQPAQKELRPLEGNGGQVGDIGKQQGQDSGARVKREVAKDYILDSAGQEVKHNPGNKPQDTNIELKGGKNWDIQQSKPSSVDVAANELNLEGDVAKDHVEDDVNKNKNEEMRRKLRSVGVN